MKEEADKNSKLKHRIETQIKEEVDKNPKLKDLIETQMKEVADKSSELRLLTPSKKDILCVELAGLCHDLGRSLLVQNSKFTFH